MSDDNLIVPALLPIAILIVAIIAHLIAL